MFKSLDYRTVRALQICVVFIATLALQRALNFSHAGWIGFAVMMIYAGFDSGASLYRTKHRFWGAMFGLFLSYFLFIFILFNDDLIWVIIPIILFLAYFTVSKYYVAPTTFTVTMTGLGSDYYQSNSFSIDQFFFDYGEATTIAFCLCVFFEYFIFRKNNLTGKFYQEFKQLLINQLQILLDIVREENVRHSRYLKASAEFRSNLIKFESFLKTAKHNYSGNEHIYNDVDDFNQTIERVFYNIRQLFVLGSSEYENLALDAQLCLNNLCNKNLESKSDEE
ncbi:MAG: FUSC family protein [Legionellaceae bacterium]|nr:FUSC family protein [Legionellaceae bacterium]